MKKPSHLHPSIASTLKTGMSFLLTLQLGYSAHAQFDDFEEVPPPPPPGNFSNPSSPSKPGTTGLPTNGSSANGKPGAPGSNANPQKDRLTKAGIEDITNENFPETIESFDFPNADIQDIVKAISELTGKNFIIDPGVRGKITIIAPSKITVAEAYKAFLSALAINGYAIVPSGNFLKIRSARYAQRDGIETYAGAYYPNADQMITRIIHLKHISSEMVNRELRILVSKDGEISPYTATNSLIISDYGANIERISRIIEQLDVQGFEDQLEVLPIKYAKAKDIAELLNKIVNKGETQRAGSQGGTFSAGVPRFSRGSTTSTQGSSFFMVIPDDRTNSLIIVGNQAGIARVKKLIAQLDFRIRPEDSGGVYVYYVQNGEAEKIAQTLSGIAKDASPKPSSSSSPATPAVSPISGVQATQEIFGGDVKITADKGTNSLVIVASKQDYEVVLRLIRQIDIPRDQVYVEAIIMEMSITDTFNWEIATVQYKDGAYGKAGFIGMQPGTLTDILNPVAGSGAILGWGSDSNVNVKIPPTTPGGTPTTQSFPSLLSFVNFLKKNTNANILSTPQVLALDNQEATITVSDNVVTGQNVTLGTATTPSQSSAQFTEVKIELKIKPFISLKNNTIRMELAAEVGQLSNTPPPKALADSTQPVAKRQIKTNIVVPNNATAVLGGLMKENDKEVVAKVPLLGDIPILGWLFKSRSTTKEKANLTVFLTPKIIHSGVDQKAHLDEKVSERLDYVKSVGGRDPFGSHIDKIMNKKAAKGAQPPANGSAPVPEEGLE